MKKFKFIVPWAVLSLLLAVLLGLQALAARRSVLLAGQAQGVHIAWDEAQTGKGAHGELVVAGQAVPWYRLSEYGPLFAEELALYPEGLLCQRGLKDIFLAKDLVDDKGLKIGGMGWGEHALFLSAESSQSSRRASAIAIHHEIFHTLDHWGHAHDKEWEGASKYVGVPGLLAPWDGQASAHGFIDHYSQTCPGEDKAQVYAYLMVRYRSLDLLAGSDPQLTRKVLLMKKRLAELNKGFDGAFWRKLGDRPLAGAEWAWEEEGERIALEPPKAAL